MAVSRAKKQETLKDLTTKMKGAKSIVFARYSGVSVKDVSSLRRKLKEHEVDYKVAKKTLLTKAAKEAGIQEIPSGMLDGPVAVGISYKDELIGAKLLYEFSKKTKGLELLGGMMGSVLFDRKQIKEIATLPTRDVLLSQLVRSMKAPVSGFYGVLHGILRNCVGVLKAFADKKGL